MERRCVRGVHNLSRRLSWRLIFPGQPAKRSATRILDALIRVRQSAWFRTDLSAGHEQQSDRGRYDLRRIAHDAMLQHGLLPEFSDDVLAETERIAGAASASPPEIRDLRHLLWASIDNDDLRDLDQLSVAEALADGQTRVLVAIADVDALVKKDSAIDGHARTNTTSVYTPAQIFPMLPEKLSTDLTSLNEGEERLAIVIDMMVDADGKVVAGDIYRALVLNHAKLAYNSVAAWLEGEGPAPPKLAAVNGLDELLRLQDRAAQAMRGERQARGALRLETTEARPVYENDKLVDMRPDQRNRAKELIEDFMVAANGVTARYLEKKGFPSLRRVLRSPKRWDRIVQLAAELGERLPPTPSAKALDAFLDRRRRIDPERFPDRLAVGREAARLRRICAGAAGQGERGAFRTGGARLHAFDRAQPALSGSDHAAAAEGGARRRRAALHERRADGARRPLHAAGGQCRQGRAAGAEVRRGAAPRLAHRLSASTAS